MFLNVDEKQMNNRVIENSVKQGLVIHTRIYDTTVIDLWKTIPKIQ